MTLQCGRPLLGGVQNYSTASIHQTRIPPPLASNRLRGTVSKWFDRQGYGFISTSDGSEYFVHCNNVVCFNGTKKRLFAGEYVEFDLKLGNDGRHRAIKVMCTGVARGIQPQECGDSGGCQGGSGNIAQRSQPVPFAYQPLQQLSAKFHTHHKSQPISSVTYPHPFPQPFPAAYMQHPPHPMLLAQSALACQQFPMGLQHPHMILQQHYGVSPQLKTVNLFGNNGPPKVGEARTYQHVTAVSAPGLNDESGKSPQKTATQESSREEGLLCVENEQLMLEIEGTHSLDISPPSRVLDLNVCSVSIPGDIMIVRGTLNLLGSSTSLGEFYDLLHTHNWYGAKAKDEHRKILLFLQSAPFEFTKLYRDFEFFYQGSGHGYPIRLCE